jgi:hypothetical protein
MSFADPRGGDIEDDASSTARHSLLAHAGTMLLDTSLPKIAVAVVQALVIPGIVLGAVPLLAVWFVQHVLARMSGEATLLSIVVFLAVDALLLWRFGPRLFRMVERDFWALNAALVQPLFMAMREAVRQALEARLGPAPEAVRLAGVRRRAGLVAGMLIAILAALIALGVGPLPVLFETVHSAADLPRLAREAIGNGIWAVAAYLAIAAPAWSLGEALTGTPRDLAIPDAPGEPAWRVAHLSDIHLVGEAYGFRLECGRNGPCGNAGFDRVLAALAAEDATRRLDLVVITGDITDAGRNAEWIAFADAMAAHPGLRARTLILPGNHDVNIVDRASPARLELPSSAGPWLRRLRTLAATAALQGERVRVMDATRRHIGPTLAEFLAAEGRGVAMAAFLDAGRRPRRQAPHPRDVWAGAFPMVLPPPTPDGLGVLLLDSNAQTHFSFTNALGILPAEQMRAAERAIAEYPAARWLVCLHHHMVEYPRGGVKLADRIATALTNGHWAVSRLRRHAPRIVVLHGHRHTDWAGEAGIVRILSAPSPVMGEGYFWIQELTRGTGNGLRLAGRVRVEPKKAGQESALPQIPPRLPAAAAPTCEPTPLGARSPPPSRHAGSASRRTGN